VALHFLGDMIGVTIAIGPKYRFFAEQAAKRVEKYLGIETMILGDGCAGMAANICPADVKELSCVLKFYVFEATAKDKVFYFDADWGMRRPPSKEELAMLESDNFLCVKDRIHCDSVKECEKRVGIEPGTYFNAGFFVANRRRHYEVFRWCQDNYENVAKCYWDQCVFNHALPKLAKPITYLPHEWNDMDGITQNPIARHVAENYDLYAREPL
jgi:hypothetical protein